MDFLASSSPRADGKKHASKALPTYLALCSIIYYPLAVAKKVQPASCPHPRLTQKSYYRVGPSTAGSPVTLSHPKAAGVTAAVFLDH